MRSTLTVPVRAATHRLTLPTNPCIHRRLFPSQHDSSVSVRHGLMRHLEASYSSAYDCSASTPTPSDTPNRLQNPRPGLHTTLHLPASSSPAPPSSFSVLRRAHPWPMTRCHDPTVCRSQPTPPHTPATITPSPGSREEECKKPGLMSTKPRFRRPSLLSA